MRIMAMMNQKGGVGKTTTAVNLGAALAEAGQRVCLIDMDPQAHLTINYGLEPSGEQANLYDVLCGDQPLKQAMHAIGERITIVPSSIDLAAAEVELVSVIGREGVLKRKLAQVDCNFDYLILDCPPSLGVLTLNALSVADEVIIPMQPHFLSLQGVAKLLETIALVSERMNPALKVSGVVLTMFDAQTRLSAEVVHELESFFDAARDKRLPWSKARIFATRIRRNIKLAESPSFGQTILQYEPASNGAADYRALAKEIIDGPEERPGTRIVTQANAAPAPEMAGSISVEAAQCDQSDESKSEPESVTPVKSN